MRADLSCFIVLAMLMWCGCGLDWQGTGNFTTSNKTIIFSYIDAHFDLSWQKDTICTQSGSDTTLVDFATNFSNYLNGLWDPAWNVVVVYNSQTNSDAIVYGFSFWLHWLWINGKKMNDGNYVSIILWKDYNCIQWYTINANKDYNGVYSTYDRGINDLFHNFIYNNRPSFSHDDMWSSSINFLKGMTASSAAFGTDPTVYTMITTEMVSPLYYCRVCAKNFYISF